MSTHVLAIDQGTTSSRAILFDADFQIVAMAQREFTQHFPHAGWVEHDAEEIWESVVATCREALQKADVAAKDVAAVGITNQRETVVVWDRATGRPIHKAIVWQDRRTAETCARLRAEGHEGLLTERTGLLADPYFSGTKVAWILDHIEGSRALAKAGALAFGTIDSFLIWRLTGGATHATDATNASRTLFYDIDHGRWDDDLLRLMNVPASVLADVRDSAADYGETLPELFGGAIPILGVAGDQQAATIGQACFQPGMMKSTYGTGCFAVLNTGPNRVHSKNRMLSTIAYQLDGKPTYALEGSIFVAGAAVQWLRDGLGLIADAAESGALAAQSDPEQHVYLVPAFVGLGAPYWKADASGLITGLTRGTGPREFARAALESVAYQTRDLLEAMRRDWPGAASGDTVLRVDGGMVASDWTMQFLADILDAEVDRPRILETTTMGAAYLAGMRAGVYPGLAEYAAGWRAERRFSPAIDAATREAKYAGWTKAMERTLLA